VAEGRAGRAAAGAGRMMSINSFRPVDGFIAVPRARPFGRLSMSIGREWTPLQTRAKRRNALYAAASRTCCLNVDAFRKIARWDRHQQLATAVPPERVPDARPADPFDWMAAAGADAVPFPTHRPAAAEAPRIDAARPAAPPPSPTRAAVVRRPRITTTRIALIGACVVGGLMLLALRTAIERPESAPADEAVIAAAPISHADAEPLPATQDDQDDPLAVAAAQPFEAPIETPHFDTVADDPYRMDATDHTTFSAPPTTTPGEYDTAPAGMDPQDAEPATRPGEPEKTDKKRTPDRRSRSQSSPADEEDWIVNVVPRRPAADPDNFQQ